jgi:hypothetical protein
MAIAQVQKNPNHEQRTEFGFLFLIQPCSIAWCEKIQTLWTQYYCCVMVQRRHAEQALKLQVEKKRMRHRPSGGKGMIEELRS